MSDLYALADRFRSQVAGRERAAAAELVRAYGQAWTRIRAELDQLTQQIEAERKAGRAVSLTWLFRQERLQKLLAGAEAELREFAQFAEERITAEQAAAVEAAQRHTDRLVQEQMSARADTAEVRTSFQRLPKEALNDLVGFTSDGTPLRALLDELGPSGSAAVRKALVQGVATGANPRQIAREVRKELGGDLVRALRISRTEVLRSYRESSIRGMQANGVVERWRWNATKTTRTCAMCLAMDGREFPVTTPFGSHPNCRCGPIPVTRYFTPAETGAEWFARQSEADQRQILGPGKFAAYREGKIRLEDLVAEHQDPKWGTVRSVRSLEEAERAAKRRKQAGSAGSAAPAAAAVRKGKSEQRPSPAPRVVLATGPELPAFLPAAAPDREALEKAVQELRRRAKRDLGPLEIRGVPQSGFMEQGRWAVAAVDPLEPNVIRVLNAAGGWPDLRAAANTRLGTALFEARLAKASVAPETVRNLFRGLPSEYQEFLTETLGHEYGHVLTFRKVGDPARPGFDWEQVLPDELYTRIREALEVSRREADEETVPETLAEDTRRYLFGRDSSLSSTTWAADIRDLGKARQRAKVVWNWLNATDRP